MLEILSEILQLAWAVLSHWQLLATGGVVTGLVTLFERKREKPLAWRVYRWIPLVFIFVAFFLAWHDEHSALGVALLAKQAAEKTNAGLTEEVKGRDRRIAELEAKAVAPPRIGPIGIGPVKSQVRSLIRDLSSFQAERKPLEEAVADTLQAGTVGNETMRLCRQQFSERLRTLAAELPQYLSVEGERLRGGVVFCDSAALGLLLETLRRISASL